MTETVSTEVSIAWYDPDVQTDPTPRHRDPFLQAWSIARAFEPVSRELWGAWWPVGHCNLTCLMLNPVLRAIKDYDTNIVMGRVRPIDGMNGGGAHAWIESADGDIIDPTFGQFREGTNEPALLVMRARERGDLFDPQLSIPRYAEEHFRCTIRRSDYGSGGSSMKYLFRLIRAIDDTQTALRLVATD